MANRFQITQNLSYGATPLTETAAFVDLFQAANAAYANKIKNLKHITIRNTGKVAIEIEYTLDSWVDATPDTNIASPAERLLKQILPAGQYIYWPSLRILDLTANATTASGGSSGNAYVLNNKLPSDINSTALFQVSGNTLGAALDDTDTTVTVNASTHDFYVGDLIQIGTDTTTATRQEIMRITAISGATLTVERALYGTSKADKDSQTDSTEGAVSGARIHLPFFNIQTQSNHYGGLSTASTDSRGIYHSMNFFGYGRYTNSIAAGIVPGSISGKFYAGGYQDLGLSGVSSASNSGLAASTEYGFDITVDGSGLLNSDTMKFTTDASTLSWGGTNGILAKINEVFSTQFYTTSSNIAGERVSVGIVGGDVRFSSGQRLSTSAILLAAPSEGETTPFGVGRIPAIGDINSPVAARIPSDIVVDKTSGVESVNEGVFFYDDGNSKISGSASGSINYTTGEFNITGPANAHFVISANYGSAASGGLKLASPGNRNGISNIAARSLNHKIEGLIEITATEE